MSEELIITVQDALFRRNPDGSWDWKMVDETEAAWSSESRGVQTLVEAAYQAGRASTRVAQAARKKADK